MKTITILFSLICLTFSINISAQKTSTYTSRVYFEPDGNGLIGSATLVYAFANCYQSAVMAHGYRDLQVDAVQYDGKKYSAQDLGESDLSVYAMSFSRLEASYSYGNTHISNRVLTYIQDSYDVGCLGQTSTITDNKDMAKNPGPFSVRFSNAKLAMDGGLGFRIRNLEKERRKKEKYESLLSTAKYDGNPNSKLQTLKEARNYAKDTYEIDALIAEIENELEQEREQELARERELAEEREQELQRNSSETEQETASSYKSNTQKEPSTDSQTSNLASGYASKAQFYRDQASKINPKYQFELEEKNRLLAEARKYEQLHQKEISNQQILEGSNEISSSNTTEDNSQSSTQSTQVNTYDRAVDMSGSKTVAAGAALATSAILASEASRIGIGLNYGYGEIDYLGAEGMFLFSEHFGLRVGYALSTDGDTSAQIYEDGYRIDAGIIYDFANGFDGLGIGADIYYEDYQKQYDNYGGDNIYQSGNNLYTGLSLYLGIIKVSYGQQISGENLISDSLSEDYESSGILSAGLFFYF
ncbi:hypothetical protein [Maribacter sp. 2308TA10-17]|uniref:hypothetical protein n=1 Tax=Maribacter sp. 2308TA10-17 TaxID=3386276 RepID=UPI0039BCEF7A